MALRLPIAAVVPTVGESPLLGGCLAALTGQGIRTVLVAQGSGSTVAADRVIRVDRPLGFAAAANLGLAEVAEPFAAVVNDDAIVAGDWGERLLAALELRPEASSVQGLNLIESGEEVDGAGIGWNRWWQAIQIGHREAPIPIREEPTEVFGVSATAAIYRREAIAALGGAPFDERLDSYYEDVELSVRLRSLGRSAWSVPSARARHVGSLSSRRAPLARELRIRAHRYPVVAELLGRSFWPRLPRMLLRDVADAITGGPRTALAVLRGGLRASRLLPSFARAGRPLVPLAEIERFRVG